MTPAAVAAHQNSLTCIQARNSQTGDGLSASKVTRHSERNSESAQLNSFIPQMFRTRLKIAGVLFGLSVLAVGAASSASGQQPQQNSNAAAPSQGRAQMRRMMMRRRAMGGMMRGIRQLDLTDQQKQQARSIMQTQFQSAQAQRQELRQLMQKRRTATLTSQEEARAKELRQQLMQSRQGVRTQLMTVLTAEQKAKLEEMIKTRRANHEKPNPRKGTLL